MTRTTLISLYVLHDGTMLAIRNLIFVYLKLNKKNIVDGVT